MNKANLDLKRSFKGVFPPVSNFDKKHLRSYLKGYEWFKYKRQDFKVEYELSQIVPKEDEHS